MDIVIKVASAIAGAIISFFTGIPAIIWVLIGVMTLDYATGLVCAAAGKSDKTESGKLSSSAAREGLMRKMMIIFVVLLAILLDCAVQVGAGVSFSAVTGATCLWFIASEGLSILENAAELGLPIPGVVTQALEAMKKAGGTDEEDEEDEA